MNIWFGDPEAYFIGQKDGATSKVLVVRHMEHADLPYLEQMIRTETYDIFGDVNIGRIYEASCLSVVQCNDKRNIVSGMCLCNYPNVPAVPPQDWPVWLETIYGVENAMEGNTLFVHFLVWDHRYTGCFFEDFLTGLFDIASYLHSVILVLPPRLIPGDVFENKMTRILPKQFPDNCYVQSLYIAVHHTQDLRLKVRRIVEEDNDDVIPIIEEESSFLKEFYGEYYVSEIVRYADDQRQLIVSENSDGLATGAMFLNCTMDVDTLNEKFELYPYNGLRKSHEEDVIPFESMEPASETFFPIFSKKPRGETIDRGARLPVLLSSDRSMEASEVTTDSKSSDSIASRNEPSDSFHRNNLDDLSPISDHSDAHCWPKTEVDAIEDTLSHIPYEGRRSVPTIEDGLTLPFEDIWLPPQPIYQGDANAFAIEIFATRKEIKPRWCRNFVQAAFECFPHLDYCSILVPFSHPFLPLLEHFVRVPLRCNKDHPEILCVTHRAALLGQIKCREAHRDDRDNVQELLKNIPKMDKILTDFNTAVKKESNLLCYVIQWNDTIVGTAILCLEEDTTYIKRRYHVEDYISTQNIPHDMYGRIIHFIMMPVFSIHLRNFFCEIMRLNDLIVLYYRLTENALSALTRSQPLAICLNAMVSVKPRRRIDYKYQGFVENDEPEKENELFSLFMTTPRLALITNSIIDTKVVVVGASDCGVAFIERLALGSSQDFARFTNLTLISPNGLPFEDNHGHKITSMLPFQGRYCREYRRQVASRAWINIIYGTVISINRKEKYVSVMKQGNITYNYLILTCGLQYQRPRFQQELKAQKKGELLEYETPWNCLTINDDTDAATCIEKIQLLTNNFENERKIIFYGHNIDCYCALQAFLISGLQGSWITLIRPPLQKCESYQDAFFGDCEVHAEVMNSIVKSGVEIMLGWELIDWQLQESTEGKIIESLVLQLKGQTKIINCDVLINFYEKTINMKIFLAICRAGLVFDGQLVIDPEFRTNDPFVFAAGTITKYRRKYYAESWQHKYYNTMEIGERLAKVIRTIIYAEHRTTAAPDTESPDSKSLLTLPTFRSSIVIACTLPGGYHYLHVRKPGKIILRDLAIRYDFYGEVMATGSCTSDIGYFRLRLNSYDTVEAITCFSKKDFEVYHIISLYGKHESLLNEVKTRFQNSLIADFFEYFREPWAMAIFYDRFDCLRVENRATLLSKTAIPGQSLVDDCLRALIKSKWEPMLENDRRCIETRYVDSVYQQELEERLLDLLQFAEEDIPVYCTPGKMHELYADTENSPVYTEL